MRYCPSCKVKVEGARVKCPLCQNGLNGDAEEKVYPTREELQKQSYLYKIQLFVFVIIMLSSMTVDFFMNISGSFHWSFLVVVWVIGGELWLSSIIHRHANPSRIVMVCSLWLMVLTMLTALIIGFAGFYFAWVLPGMCLVVEILHFVYMMLDKAQNAMIYLLGNNILCILAGIIYHAIDKEELFPSWIFVVLVGVIGIVGAVIFKGRHVTSELEKRFHI